jgi:hypothetical protein
VTTRVAINDGQTSRSLVSTSSASTLFGLRFGEGRTSTRTVRPLNRDSLCLTS